MSLDLEGLKAIFADKRQHIAIASILKIELASDRSHLKCLVSIFPEQRQMIAKMTWESAGPNSGIFQFPAPNDIVLVAFADGDENQLFVIRRLTSKEDKIPMQAVGGDTSMISLTGKRVWITSDNKIYFSKGTGEPTEPLVLGNVLKTLLSFILQTLAALCEKVSMHTHPGNLGYPTGAPNEAADFITIQNQFNEKKSDPVDNSGILSNFVFTEKGS